MRYTLKLLLMYKGWMYETRGKGSKVSLTTRIWGVATKILSNWNTPGLYSFQGSLPRLPLPSVRDTTQRVCVVARFIFHQIEIICLFSFLFFNSTLDPFVHYWTIKIMNIWLSWQKNLKQHLVYVCKCI